MNDHNLDDLIIDNIEPKNNKAKSFLTIIALIIVVLIVAIVFTKTVLNEPKNTEIALEENMTDLISPELTLQSKAEAKTSQETPKDETKLSSMIEEKLTAPKKTEEIKKETVEINEEKSAPGKEHIASVPKVPEVPKPVSAKPAKKEVSAPVKVPTVPKETSKPAHADKIVVPKQVYRESPAPAAAKKTAAAEHYYIQVGSFSQTPSTRFLNTIKKHGFHYKITAPTSNGTKKLLIGPYPSRVDADNALVRVKDRINKGAFIVKK